MKRSLTQASARESTTRAFRVWLAGYDPGDGQGPVGDKLADTDLFGPDVVEAAFAAGADHAAGEFAVERSTGQSQLDDATSLMREAAEHIRGALGTDDRPESDSALVVARLEAWLKGEVRYPVRASHPLYDTKCGLTEADRWRIQFREEGRQARRDGKRIEECPAFPTIAGQPDQFAGVSHGEEWMAGWREEDGPNVRPVTVGPLADGAIVDGVASALGLVEDGRAVSMAGEDVFRLQTVDPRFNPARPVKVNGFAYHPATEDQ